MLCMCVCLYMYMLIYVYVHILISFLLVTEKLTMNNLKEKNTYFGLQSSGTVTPSWKERHGGERARRS